jgi:hypothetical protein
VRIALTERDRYALIEDNPWLAGSWIAVVNPLGKIPVRCSTTARISTTRG